MREIVTTLAEGSDDADTELLELNEGPAGVARRSKLKLMREIGLAGSMPLVDLDAMAPSEEKRQAKRDSLGKSTADVYKTNLTLRGAVPIGAAESVGDTSVAVELERSLHELLSTVPRNATRTVRQFVTGGTVSEAIRASPERSVEMERVDQANGACEWKEDKATQRG